MIRKSPHRTHRDERYFEIRCAALEVRVRDLETGMREIYEVYAGSDGFVPVYASEAYQQRLIKQMAEIAGRYLTAGKSGEC